MARSAKDPATAGPAKVRVLLDCVYGRVDEVVELPAELIQEAIDSGAVDANPAAVAYAESLKN